MRVYRTVAVPASTRQVVDKVICDLCGKQGALGTWESSSYEVEETEIQIKVRQKDGESYPETGWGTEYNVDMCPDCFKDKLIPWLESQGCTAERKDWDW